MSETTTPRIWQHQPGDTYVTIVTSLVGNPDAGYEFVRYVGSESPFADWREAWTWGLDHLDRSDDFNLGVIRNGWLVATLWTNEVVDDDPAAVAKIASRCGFLTPSP